MGGSFLKMKIFVLNCQILSRSPAATSSRSPAAANSRSPAAANSRSPAAASSRSPAPEEERAGIEGLEQNVQILPKEQAQASVRLLPHREQRK